MNREEKLESLNDKVLDKMLEWIDNDETDRLPELNVPVQFLAKNNMVAEKKVSSREEQIKARAKQAKERRLNADTNK